MVGVSVSPGRVARPQYMISWPHDIMTSRCTANSIIDDDHLCSFLVFLFFSCFILPLISPHTVSNLFSFKKVCFEQLFLFFLFAGPSLLALSFWYYPCDSTGFFAAWGEGLVYYGMALGKSICVRGFLCGLI